MRRRLLWDWVKRVRGMEIAQVLRAWYEAMRLFPRGRRWKRGGRPTLLSLAEQVFAEVRRWVEGRRYERTEAKKVAVEGGAARVGGWGEGLIAGRVALYPLSSPCPAFMMKKLCL
jgi:hypothetical protein